MSSFFLDIKPSLRCMHKKKGGMQYVCECEKCKFCLRQETNIT